MNLDWKCWVCGEILKCKRGDATFELNNHLLEKHRDKHIEMKQAEQNFDNEMSVLSNKYRNQYIGHYFECITKPKPIRRYTCPRCNSEMRYSDKKHHELNAKLTCKVIEYGKE